MIGCSTPADKPYYTISSNQITPFSVNDLLVSAVLGTRDLGVNEFNGELEFLLRTPDRTISPGTTPDSLGRSVNIDANLLTSDLKDENWGIEFFQQDNGAIRILYISLSDGTHLWIEDPETTLYDGVAFLPSPLETGTSLSSSFDIYVCDVSCNTSSPTSGQILLSLVGIEKQETELAFFDAHHVTFSLNMSYLKDTITKSYVLSGDFWFHPVAGIIKSSLNRSITSDADANVEYTSLFTSLAETNRKLSQ